MSTTIERPKITSRVYLEKGRVIINCEYRYEGQLYGLETLTKHTAVSDLPQEEKDFEIRRLTRSLNQSIDAKLAS